MFLFKPETRMESKQQKAKVDDSKDKDARRKKKLMDVKSSWQVKIKR